MQQRENGNSAIRLADSVVKIFVRSVGDNYTSPWTKRPQNSSTGSGFCIDSSLRRILTNAHVVGDAVSVRVRKHGDPNRYPATVLCVSPQCDLALLEVPSDEFWVGVSEITLTEEVPSLDSDVLAVGYPMGGDNISVTRGVVSRIDLMDYTFSPVGGERLPVIQVDAAINPGNSGGPVLTPSGRAVGVAFAGLQNSSNIGYVIPGCVALFFLRGYTSIGRFPGLCSLGVRVQPTQSPALRSLHGLDKHQKGTDASTRGGVLVVAVAPLSSACSSGLTAGDIVLSIDGVPIADDGTVPFRTQAESNGATAGERIGFDFLVTRKVVGEPIIVEVARKTEEGIGASVHIRKLELTASPIQKLVPRTRGVDAKPSFLVVGGLVFVPLSVPWLETRFQRSLGEAPPQLLQKIEAFKEEEGEEVVVLAKVLAAEVNYGYEDFMCMPVTRFGVYGRGSSRLDPEEKTTKIRSLRHLRDLVLDATSRSDSDFLRFILANNLEVVLDAGESRSSTSEILRQHAIPSDCSDDLLLPSEQPSKTVQSRL